MGSKKQSMLSRQRRHHSSLPLVTYFGLRPIHTLLLNHTSKSNCFLLDNKDNRDLVLICKRWKWTIEVPVIMTLTALQIPLSRNNNQRMVKLTEITVRNWKGGQLMNTQSRRSISWSKERTKR